MGVNIGSSDYWTNVNLSSITPVDTSWGQFHRNGSRYRSLQSFWKSHIKKYCVLFPRANELISLPGVDFLKDTPIILKGLLPSQALKLSSLMSPLGYPHQYIHWNNYLPNVYMLFRRFSRGAPRYRACLALQHQTYGTPGNHEQPCRLWRLFQFDGRHRIHRWHSR